MEKTETQEYPVTVIVPPKGWISLNLQEIWEFRDLLFIFIWRDLKVRYKQTALGVLWAVIGPVANAIVFTFIFGNLAKLPTDNLPPALFFMAGLTIWRYFSNTLSAISGSLVGGAGLYTKIYFPKLLVPINTCIAGLADLAISLVILFALMIYFHTIPPLTTALLIPLTLIAMLTALGVGLFFGALNVRYRDAANLVPFLLQFWMYASILLPSSKVQSYFANRYGATLGRQTAENIGAILYGLNPVAGVVEGYRWCLMHHAPGANIPAPWFILAAGMPFLIVTLVSGLYYFKRVESQFADIV